MRIVRSSSAARPLTLTWGTPRGGFQGRASAARRRWCLSAKGAVACTARAPRSARSSPGLQRPVGERGDLRFRHVPGPQTVRAEQQHVGPTAANGARPASSRAAPGRRPGSTPRNCASGGRAPGPSVMRPCAQQQFDVAVVASALQHAAPRAAGRRGCRRREPSRRSSLHEAGRAGGARRTSEGSSRPSATTASWARPHDEVQQALGIEQRAARRPEICQHRLDGDLGARAPSAWPPIPSTTARKAESPSTATAHAILVFFPVSERASVLRGSMCKGRSPGTPVLHVQLGRRFIGIRASGA